MSTQKQTIQAIVHYNFKMGESFEGVEFNSKNMQNYKSQETSD